MTHPAIALSTILLLFSALAAGQAKTIRTTGWVSDTMGAAKGDKKCSDREHLKQGAKLVIVTDNDNKIWIVQNAPKVEGFQGDHVRFNAVTTDESMLKVKSVTKVAESKK
jgi:outer membrane lipoprotein SlyB